MPAKTVALLVDVESLHRPLHTQHHRALDPQLLLDEAGKLGKVTTAVAVADWSSLPETLQVAFAELPGVERVQVERRAHHGGGGRRREVQRDVVDLELLAQAVELLMSAEGETLSGVVLATCEAVAARIAGLIREQFELDVHVLAVEGALDDELREAATTCAALPMPAVAPTDLDGLGSLVPLLEELERRKRYLNFKYIRDTTARKLEHLDRSWDAAEQLLSEAIACGLLRKLKVEDKYKPGQLFTAYALDREHELFAELGSGEPAPIHEDEEPAVEAAEAAEQEPAPKKKRRRKRRKPEEQEEVRRSEPAPTALSAGAAKNGRNGRRRNKRGNGNQNHQQDRLGRAYEAPSRFLVDPHDDQPDVRDDEVDEAAILRALGHD